jgi:mRNA interferase MazF
MAVAVGRTITRGEVHLVRLDPTLGSEIKKTRPCLVVSPDELNQHLRTVIVAPLTTGGQAYPWRVPCRFQNRSAFVVLDQLRTVDSERLLKRLGRLSSGATTEVLDALQEMFAE